MNNNNDETYYKVTGNEYTGEKSLSMYYKEILAYILKHHVVSFNSIRFYFSINWVLDEVALISIMQALINENMVIKVPTKKQAEEPQLQNPGWVLTEAEERQAKMQEKTTEIQALHEEYSRKRRELNRIFEKQEKAKEELTKLSNEDYRFYHGED